MKLAKRFAGISMLACVLVSGDVASESSLRIIPQDPTAKLTSEVRLRKLHLVRPDLIGYPIVFEIYC